jgi:Uma2 family endonuclease
MNKPASISFAPAGPAHITTAEFERMCRADVFGDAKIELVDGELQRMMSPMAQHAGRQARIIGALYAALGPESPRLMGETGIDLGNDTVVGCDVALLVEPVSEHRWLQPQEVLLVIEVSETTRSRDMGLKRTKYASAGIPNYWVVDGDRSVVHIWGEPVHGDYAQIATVRFGEPLAVPGTDQTIVIA